jgi:hypothetical protein
MWIFCSQNYKILPREIREDIKNENENEKFNILKMKILPMLIDYM